MLLRTPPLRFLRRLAVPALALGVIIALPLAQGATPGTTQAGWTPLTPVAVQLDDIPARHAARGNLLAFNDFHGAIDPPTGSGGLVVGNPAGGVEFLTTWVKRLRAEGQAAGEQVVTVGAGDMVGATPLVSAAFHDEPTIELLNELGMDISSVGNHEFDEGTVELKRLINGGCHPVDGCADGDGYDGAEFTYLAANAVNKRTGLPILAPFSIKIIQGVPVGFIGMTLEGTMSIVNPGAPGNPDIQFLDEIQTANKWSRLLRAFGVKAQVLLIHEGGLQTPANDVNGCAAFAGAITDIVAGLRNEFGVVVSGHTHRFYSCSLPNAEGNPVVVTSAGSNGTLVSDISFTLDKRTRKFASIEARNVIVENGIRNPDGSWGRDAQGNFLRNPALIDPGAKVISDKYRTAVAPIANRVVGKITADISRDAVASGESPLGDVIADAQLAYTAAAGGQIALMNPGGIRAPLTFANSPGGEPAGDVTYGECFTVQPFNNLVVTQTFTGAQLKAVLEQQFAGHAGQTVTRILQPSAGFTYSYDTTRALGDRTFNLALGGTPIDPAATYRVTTNDFLANGGDGFTTLQAGTDRATAPGFDVDALVAYLATGPIAPGPANRIIKIA
ncbi:bifunctional metallophosphatase/5'-nucleotidase [Allorhizocola rhizosphaerae]|uniref:bifunctional metallophosphatase/5'-nucleotidase n=1 Tax=Allorhizocola rhizosphaerae TaxID=1872709 RepID=UPI000E3DEA9B|nr:5'-nucleotidase C-terminal domain-containing protein [Allorhizocola rhizosphaerae]